MNTLVLEEQVPASEPNWVSGEFSSRIAYLEQESQTLLESMRYAGSL